MMTHYKGHQGIHRVHAKNFVCPICNAAFTKQAKLDEHLASSHNSCITATQGGVSISGVSPKARKIKLPMLPAPSTTNSTIVISDVLIDKAYNPDILTMDEIKIENNS